MGAPRNLDEIKPFLYRLFSDREIINFGVPEPLQKPLAYLIATFRAPKVKPQYEAIGGGSPLVPYTQEQARLLEEELGIPVFTGMLYSEPLLEKVAEEILKRGVSRLYALTLYPHFSYATAGACLKRVEELLKGKLELKSVKRWHKNPYYVEWIRKALERELEGLPKKRTLLLFSAHSLPEYFVKEKKDPYPEEIKESVELAVEPFKGYDYKIAYQSKVGPIKWLEPSTEEEIVRAKEEGYERLIVFPISFVSEHIETLYELDVEYGELAKELGLEYIRVKLNHKSPLLLKALKEEVEKLRSER